MNALYVPFYSGKINVSVFAPAAFLVMAFSEGILYFSVMFSAALLHEAGHIFAIYKVKSSVVRVYIEPFGALISYSPEKIGFSDEKTIVIAGVAVNILLSAVSALFFVFFKNEYVLLFLLSNMFFAVINLVPLSENDGGKLIFLIFEEKYGQIFAEKAEKIVSFIGMAVLLAVFFVLMWFSGFNGGLCILLLVSAIPK